MFPNGAQMDEASDQQLRAGDEGSPTRAYITISQASHFPLTGYIADV